MALVAERPWRRCVVDGKKKVSSFDKAALFSLFFLSLTKKTPTFFFKKKKKTQLRRLRRAFSALPLSIFTPYENLPADGRVREKGILLPVGATETEREFLFFLDLRNPFLPPLKIK